MRQSVIGVFDTPDAAHLAEEKLIDRGIDRSCLHLAANDSAYRDEAVGREGEREGGHRSATDGIRDFFSELFGTPHSEEAGNYSEAVRRGGVILAVDVEEGEAVEPVREALLDAGAVDIDERIEQWRQQGYTGYNPEAPAYTADEVARERSTVLPVIREELEVGKREVGKGTVRVVTRTVETPVDETVTLREEHATIERRPVDRPASDADLQALGERSIEVREMAEKAVVKKTARVVEEVEVGKEVTEHTETIHDTVRHTEVAIDRDGGAGGESGIDAGASGLRSYEDYEPDYREDFRTRYAASGGSYDDYAPAYRYGCTLAGDTRYSGRKWDDIEADARRDWESRHPGSDWERFKAAVRHAWEKMTG